MSLTASYVDRLKPTLNQALQSALSAGSGNLDSLNSILTIAQRTGDQPLITQVEASITNDSKAVKTAFAGALVDACKAVGLPVQIRGEAYQGKRRGRKPGSKNKQKQD